MMRLQLIRRFALRTLPLAGALILLPAPPTNAQAPGCQVELGGPIGAHVSAQVLQRSPAGALTTVAGPSARVEARSGQILRLLVRPLPGPAQPAGAECQVKVNTGRLSNVARLLSSPGFTMDKGVFYDSLRVGEERVIEYEMKPFEERTSVIENIELEDAEVSLPESLEFVARLPSAEPPPPGTVCADVVYADARPAVGVMLGLAVPPDGPVDERATGDDGRVCWEGFDEFLFGDLSLQSPAVAALGQPRSRYVSTEANYRLFVIKRPT